MFARAGVVWCVVLVAAVMNGFVRTQWLIPKFGDPHGHMISVLLLCLWIFALTWLLVPWMHPTTGNEALRIGVFWLMLTLLFEFGFGHYVAGRSWSYLLHDYDVLQGRIWVLVLVSTAIAPLIVGRARSLWA
jgi:hypothetical protein